MPRTDDPTVFVPNMRAEFKSANPEVFAKAQGDLDTTRRLGVIEMRAEAISDFRRPGPSSLSLGAGSTKVNLSSLVSTTLADF